MARTNLADQPEHDLTALSASERIAMVWQLTLDAWATSGKELPSYERSQMPGRLVRRGRGGDAR